MTVNYNDVISSGSQGVFLRLLSMWKGSLYKLVWLDLLIYVVIYYVINLVYRFTLNEDQRRIFEKIVEFCENMKNNIPVSFLLGFFVAGVIARWWKMYYAIPWLNRIAFASQSFLYGNGNENSRVIRMTLMRYMNLGWILLMREISDQIKVRFRMNNEEDSSEESSIRGILENINRDQMVQATFRKIVTEIEIKALEDIAAERDKRYREPVVIKGCTKAERKYIPEFWIPLQWGARLVQKAYVQGYLSDPRTMVAIMEEIDELRRQMETLKVFSGILIPLVYTQVVIIAVYSYFLCHLFAAQFVDPAQKIIGHEVDFYFPVFTIFQFLFLMGWLKVAMCVMNPFGDDDEDFETSDMLDYNLTITFRSAGAENDMYPPLLQPAVVNYKKCEHAADDNLPQAVEAEKMDFDSAPFIDHIDKVIHQEDDEPSPWSRIKGILTCKPIRKDVEESRNAKMYSVRGSRSTVNFPPDEGDSSPMLILHRNDKLRRVPSNPHPADDPPNHDV